MQKDRDTASAAHAAIGDMLEAYRKDPQNEEAFLAAMRRIPEDVDIDAFITARKDVRSAAARIDSLQQRLSAEPPGTPAARALRQKVGIETRKMREAENALLSDADLLMDEYSAQREMLDAGLSRARATRSKVAERLHRMDAEAGTVRKAPPGYAKARKAYAAAKTAYEAHNARKPLNKHAAQRTHGEIGSELVKPLLQACGDACSTARFACMQAPTNSGSGPCAISGCGSPCRSWPAGESSPAVMPLARHDSLAGKLPQIQAELPL
jgi:hypothetical protein